MIADRGHRRPPDCGGEFNIWWRPNVPGFNSGIKDDANQPMLSWFPYLYY